MIDHRDLDLDGAHRITYRIDQSFRYSYDSPITALTQRLVVVPRRRHGDQHRRTWALHVTGAVTRRTTRQNAAGNTVVHVRAERVDTDVEFHITALVDRVRGGATRPDSALPQSASPDTALHDSALPESALRDPRLRQVTRLTAADDRLRAMAADALRPGGGPLAIAERICTAVSAAITYEWGVTSVSTTAAEALAGGRGVCQDAAHVMMALCHLAGLPARYVSGHLLGQGGTHAWAEVIVPDRGAAAAVAFDPCNGRRADGRYLTVAVGRDYVDVAPTSGSFTGTTGGRLTTRRDVGIVAVA